jgi:uncharacterized protein (TIGR03083 family)
VTTTQNSAGTTTRITRASAPTLAEEEDRRFLQLVRSLEPDHWSAPTDCTGWDVRAIVLHVLGAAEGHRLSEFVHQLRGGRRLARDRDLVDGVNDVQIADRAHLGPDEVVRRLEAAAPRFRRSRRRLPRPLRAVRVPAPVVGRVSLGHLMDVIYTRDSWLHRVDICRAIGRELPVDGHDATIVADVVADWACRHGAPYRLVLTGPAGGRFEAGDGGECHELDAVEFCRIVSGREPGAGLLATPVLF